MATIFYESDVDAQLLHDRTVAVLGYGSQGHAHALNLRDSGIDVRVGLRPDSSSRATAEAAGLRVLDTNEAAAEADVIMILVPDTHQKGLWEGGVSEAVKEGDLLLFSHGFNVHYGFVTPPEGIDVAMIAPKSPGHLVRRTYESGQGTPAVVAVHQDATGNALQLALSYGAAIGTARAGIIQTTFKEETETDLFGEQAVLCGGISHLVQAGFETLTDAGYQPEVAYFECLHELKLIVDLMYEGGITWMRHSISDTAEYGDVTRGARIVDDHTRQVMRDMLTEIQDGTFAKEWMDEFQAGQPNFERLRAAGKTSQIEAVGKQLRSMMPWIDIPAEADDPVT